MRERDIGHSILHAHAADGAFEWHLSPEPFNGETTDKKDDPRLQERELLLEPWCAERDLRRRWSAIAASGRRLPRKAFGNRRAIRKVVLVDPRLCQPAPQLGAGATAERLSCRELDLTRGLADDRDSIADGSGDDRLRAIEVARVNAFRARSDPRVKTCERTRALDH